MTYAKAIEQEAQCARKVLLALDIDERYCHFSAEPASVPSRIWVPGQAMSKFQQEQALGDWAEAQVAAAINASGAYKAVPFGDNDKTLSQDAIFSHLYREAKVREFEFGKRSDLLLFKADAKIPRIPTTLSGQEAEILCAECEAALEVRSSRTSAKIFIEYCAQRAAEGKKPAKMEPSYTVKIEDLGKVYRWIARNRKPLIYIQVFFDGIYALNFFDVFRFINTKGSKLKLEDPARSDKPTIMIPLSFGHSIGTVTAPEFEAVHTIHLNGRHDIYARPLGGGAKIDLSALLALV